MISDDLGGYPTVLQEDKHDLQIKSANVAVGEMVGHEFLAVLGIKHKFRSSLAHPWDVSP